MTKKALDVLCVGLMFCDIIAKPLDRDIFEKDSQMLDTFKFASGGDALNAAINMSRLGLKTALAGKTGSDMMGNFLCDAVAKSGIDATYIKQNPDASTATSLVLIEHNGERHFACYGNANNFLTPDDIPDDLLKDSYIVHLGSAMALINFEGKSLADFFRKAQQNGALTSMDVTWDGCGKWLEKIEEALFYTDIFMPSLNEAQMITGLDKPDDMVDFFRKYGIKKLVIKLGEEGSLVTDFNETFLIPAFRDINVVDTTGAGDAYVSGFLTGIIHGKSLYDCGIFGTAVAAFCVTEAGAVTGVKGFDETTEFINSRKGT